MSTILHSATLVAAAGVLLTAPLRAQETNGPPSETAPIAPIEQAGRPTADRVQVESGTGDGSASIALKLVSHSSGWQRTNQDSVVRYSTDSLGLVLSTPWNGDDDALPATLDGLANGTKLTFRWGRYVSFLNTNRTPMRPLEAAARAACRQAAQDAFDAARQIVRTTPVDDPDARTRREQIIQSERARSLDACQYPTGGYGNLVNQHLRARAGEYLRMLRPRGSYEYGFEASIGRNGFSFVDPVTLAEGKDSQVQWSARAYYTRYSISSPTAFTVSAEYQRAYKAAEEAVFCPANPNNIVIRCTTAHAGPPTLNESLLLSAGIRHRFSDRGFLAHMAAAPLVTYDVLNDVLGVDVPVYFIPNSDGGLTGGVRFGYRSDQDRHFTVGVFIGAAFSILQ
jgi:hypothetical protein